MPLEPRGPTGPAAARARAEACELPPQKPPPTPRGLLGRPPRHPLLCRRRRPPPHRRPLKPPQYAARPRATPAAPSMARAPSSTPALRPHHAGPRQPPPPRPSAPRVRSRHPTRTPSPSPSQPQSFPPSFPRNAALPREHTQAGPARGCPREANHTQKGDGPHERG
eukprot:1651600-Pyramimonas_sp.AAC.2